MKICRFVPKDQPSAAPRVGLLGDDGVRDVTAATDLLPALRWPLPAGDQFIANLALLRPRMAELAAAATPICANGRAPASSPESPVSLVS